MMVQIPVCWSSDGFSLWFAMSVINLESSITTAFSRFLPSHLCEPHSDVGLFGIAAHSIVVSPRHEGELVSVPVTKYCYLTAVNRYAALCCPDFPRSRGLKEKPMFTI